MRLLLVLAFGALITLILVPYAYNSISQLDDIFDRTATESRTSATDNLVRLGRQAASNTAIHVKAAFVENNYGYLKMAVDGLHGSGEDVRFAACLDPRGKRLAESGSVGGAGAIIDQVSEVAAKKGIHHLWEPSQKILVVAAQVASATEPLGSVVLAYDTTAIQARLEADRAERDKQRRGMLQKTAMTGLLVLLVGILIAIGFGSWLAQPVSRLAGAARSIASGDFEARAQVAGPHELRQLGQTFNEMGERLKDSVRESVAKAALDRELDLARTLQMSMMPTQGRCTVGQLDACSWYVPAGVCGGDWFSYYSGPHRTILMVGDVMGHGIPAAFVTAAVKTACETALALKPDIGARELLDTIHNATLHVAAGKLTMSCVVALIDVESGKVTFGSGGHPWPFIIRPQNGAPAKTISPRIYGSLLGDDKGTPNFDEVSQNLEHGDVIVLFTDGVTEFTNPREQAYGPRRLAKTVQAAANAPVDEIAGRLRDDLGQFTEGTPQEDDITVVLARYP